MSQAALPSQPTTIDPTVTVPIFITIPTNTVAPVINVPAGAIVKPIVVVEEGCTAADAANASHICHRRPFTVVKSSGLDLKPGMWAVFVAGGFLWLLW